MIDKNVLSRTYCHKTVTRPPSCVTPLQPTMYVHKTGLKRVSRPGGQYLLFFKTLEERVVDRRFIKMTEKADQRDLENMTKL